MLDAPSSTANFAICPDIADLHSRCGVYTRTEVVADLLDAIGWTADADLLDAKLLEPATGDGQFLVEAARRLLQSLAQAKQKPTRRTLSERILAFEIHPVEASVARDRVAEVLRSFRVEPRVAAAVARSWVRTDDFLLAKLDQESFSHVAGNPPYTRWTKIPKALRSQYEARLPKPIARGDLFLPFLDLSIGYLKKSGRLGFVCSDRWRYMAFADGFRRSRLPLVIVEKEVPIEADSAYQRSVDAYPSPLVMRKRRRVVKPRPTQRVRTLLDAGYKVRVGPALGCTRAFVLGPDDDPVEPALLSPWISASEIRDGEMRWAGRHIMVMNEPDGSLRELDAFPLAKARFEKFHAELQERSIVRAGAAWYRPIDRVRAADWARPKLLVPELAKVPRVALDMSGAIPSHGVYAIFAPDDDLESLYGQFKDGTLPRALESIAPRVKGGYLRCYKRFLEQLPL